MSKPKIPVAPRKPVDESAARLLEEALERKSEGIAGGSQNNLALVPSPDARAHEITEDKSTQRPRKSDGSPKSKIKSAPASPSAPAQPNTGLGTRANPRVRKTDGIKTRSTSIHLPIDLGLRLTMFCARNGRRQSEIVALAIAAWLDQAER